MLDMISFVNWFVKITGWPVYCILFRTKVTYEDKSVQGRHIRGPAIIVSNHTSVFDFAVMLFVFLTRTLRYQMAELLFKKRFLGKFLRLLGGIYIDRSSSDMGFIGESAAVLKKGGVVGIFPEGRLPLPDETPPIAFRPGAAYLSKASGVKVIPVYTNGSYFSKKRARVVIGRPMDPADFCGYETEKQNLEAFASAMRDKIVELRDMLDG